MTLKFFLETKTVAPITLSQTTIQTRIITITTTKTVIELKESQKVLTHLMKHVERQTTPRRKATMEPMQPKDCLPGTKDREDRIRSKNEPIKKTRKKLLGLQPKIWIGNATCSLQCCNWHTGDYYTSTNPWNCRQQPPETHLIEMYKNSTTKINNSTNTHEFKRDIDEKLQKSPMKETSLQVSRSGTESLLGNETRSTPVQCSNDSKQQQLENQRDETGITTHDSEDDNFYLPK